MKIKKNPIYVSKKCSEENHVDLLLIGKGGKNTMFLSMISIDSCTIIHYMEEENIFVVIVYMLSVQKECESIILKIALKLMVNKRLRWLRKVNMLNSEMLKEK